MLLLQVASGRCAETRIQRIWNAKDFIANASIR